MARGGPKDTLERRKYLLPRTRYEEIKETVCCLNASYRELNTCSSQA